MIMILYIIKIAYKYKEMINNVEKYRNNLSIYCDVVINNCYLTV